eukprot:g20624.t1
MRRWVPRVEVMDTPKPPKPLRWRRTGPLRPKAAVALPPPVNREVKKPGVSEGREGGRRKRGIAGLLQPSTSLPVLRTTPDLVGVRDEYYEGDELFMHEDVLYSSNPRLFPLREGRKPFPTVKLTLPNFDLFNLEYVKHSTWRDAFQEASAQHALALKPTLMQAAEENKVAREALLDWAQDRLARPRALLEPQPRSQTALPEEHVQNLRKALAWRTLLPLIECFEAELDLQGAMQDLFVAIDESPWMLKMLDQRHARSLLLRVARIPMSFEWPP